MKKSRTAVPLALLVLLAGSWARGPLGGAARAAAQSESKPASGGAPEETAATTGAAVEHDAGDGDALDLLGQSLGLDFSTGALEKQVTAAVDVVRAGHVSAPDDRRSAARILQAFFALPIRDKDKGEHHARLAAARQAIATLLPDAGSPNGPSLTAASARGIDDFLAAYFDDDALRASKASDADKLLAADFDHLDKTPLKLAILRRTAASSNGRVTFLIATLPDPIDSFTGWQFDPMLDAIAQAVSESDYVLDRFHFPDSDAEPGGHAASEVRLHRVHDHEPGVLVYRKHDEGDSAAVALERLVVLIVHENPSAGVHVAALENAVRLVTRVAGTIHGIRELATDGDTVIRILGPTFSGSGDSLGRAIESFTADGVIPKGYSVRVISGSATDPANKKAIERFANRVGYTADWKKIVPVTFQATVNPDDLLLAALREHITAIGWPMPMAVLFEGNTQYGREMIELAHLNGDVLQLPFPLNISRLRTTRQANAPGGADALSLPSRFRPLSMEAIGNPADQIPQFSASTTAAYVELALAETLQTLRREHIRTVALMATDPRDKLFLAQQIARYAADVSIVTLESDSLYVHPDYSSYLQGALVVSTYPLYNGSQRWSHGFTGASERRQFANGSSEGIYNAAIALLNYDTDGGAHRPQAAQLLEYGPPGQRCAPYCRPPIWISVVGRNNAAPIASYAVNDPAARTVLNDDHGYVFSVRTPQPPISGPATVPAAFPSPLFNTLIIVLTAAIFVAWGAVIARPRGTRTLAALARGDALESAPYLLACLGGLFVIQSFVAAVTWIRVRIELPDASTHQGETLATALTLVAVVLSLLALVDLARRTLAPVIRRRHWWASRIDLKGTTTWVGVAVAALAATAFVNLLVYEWQPAVAAPGDAIGFLTRAVDVAGGTSPTVTIGFLAAAVILWGAIELARLRRPEVALAKTAVQPFVQQTINGDIEQLKTGWMLFNRSILSVPPSGLIVAVVALAAVGVFAFNPFVAPLVTTEGPAFGRFVSSALLVLELMIALALLQFVWLWSAVKGLLLRMARHPLADAYDRVPRELAPIGLFPRTPVLMELQAPVARWQQTVFAARSTAAGTTGIPNAALELAQAFQDEMKETPAIAWSKSRTWETLMNAASHTAGKLQATWRSGFVRPRYAAERVTAGGGAERGHGGNAAMPAATAAATTTAVAAPDAPFGSAEHEDVIAMAMAFIVRDAIARLGYNLAFVTGGVLLVFCSHTLFPFQARQRLEALAWSYIGLAFAAIVTVLVQINRNEVIARLTSATPGERTKWDFEFVLKLVVFGLLPLLTLFAAQFPDVGVTLLHWIEPMEKALP